MNNNANVPESFRKIQTDQYELPRFIVSQMLPTGVHLFAGSPKIGKVTLAEQDLKEVISLAKEGVLSRGKIDSLKRQLQSVTSRLWDIEEKLTRLVISTRNFKEAMRLAPQRVEAVLAEIFLRDREEREVRRHLRRSTKHRDDCER